MMKNLSNLDRTARVVVGAIILIAAVIMQSWWGLLGLALIITGTVGYCGAYQLFGFTTCKIDLPTTPVTPVTPVTPIALETPTTPATPVEAVEPEVVAAQVVPEVQAEVTTPEASTESAHVEEPKQ